MKLEFWQDQIDRTLYVLGISLKKEREERQKFDKQYNTIKHCCYAAFDAYRPSDVVTSPWHNIKLRNDLLPTTGPKFLRDRSVLMNP